MLNASSVRLSLVNLSMTIEYIASRFLCPANFASLWPVRLLQPRHTTRCGCTKWPRVARAYHSTATQHHNFVNEFSGKLLHHLIKYFLLHAAIAHAEYSINVNCTNAMYLVGLPKTETVNHATIPITTRPHQNLIDDDMRFLCGQQQCLSSPRHDTDQLSIR